VASDVERLERMLDEALRLSDLYKEAWEAERRLKWRLAERLLKNYVDSVKVADDCGKVEP
jgi:hypothetical protein